MLPEHYLKNSRGIKMWVFICSAMLNPLVSAYLNYKHVTLLFIDSDYTEDDFHY
ncbi:hypothetical protein CI610_03761 [invertebrate metagenome]|uniref:Uncharacterized protein n=1 Tax=invertebrate metagenome TaxID=1711999 RepID=A0A2H9T280_9ZZZZ